MLDKYFFRLNDYKKLYDCFLNYFLSMEDVASSVAEPAPGINFDAAPATPAPTLLLKICTEWAINCYVLCHFSIPNHV
jgi:hypothetical protein